MYTVKCYEYTIQKYYFPFLVIPDTISCLENRKCKMFLNTMSVKAMSLLSKKLTFVLML